MSEASPLDRLARHFEALRELPAERRDAALAALAAEDPALAESVADLLARDAAADSFLAQPLLAADVSLDELLGPRDGAPLRLGPFELGAPLAQGGMGVVYEAWQEHPRRRVALKVLRAGLSSPETLRRFRHEVEVLGRLRHPAIAQILDAGLHAPTGLGLSLPWFAMEFVEGARSLTAYAREQDLDVPARLALFRQVCAAVHHGHLRGVVHRDLKPANLLVDAQGRLRVIDFGVARVTDADLGLTSVGTAAGELVGTLQYMSPEQRAGDPDGVDARSDVYALGVVLFELLSGERPHRLDDSSLVAVSLALASDAPRRLGAVVPALRGDLETLVTVAMASDPGQRYASVDALSRDVGHVLAHEPLDARPPGPLLRLRLFARRRRALALGSAIAVAALLGGSAFALHGMLRARDAEQSARLSAQEARHAEGEARAAAVDAEQQRERAETAAAHAEQQRGLAEAAAALADEQRLLAETHRDQARQERALALAASERADAERRRADSQRGAALLARGQALERLAEAEAAAGFLVEVLGAAHPLRVGPDVTVRETLAAGALAARERFVDQPVLAARVLDAIGSSLAALGEVDAGRVELEHAASLRRSHAPGDPALADTLLHLVELEVHAARPLPARRWFDEARELLAAAAAAPAGDEAAPAGDGAAVADDGATPAGDGEAMGDGAATADARESHSAAEAGFELRHIELAVQRLEGDLMGALATGAALVMDMQAADWVEREEYRRVLGSVAATLTDLGRYAEAAELMAHLVERERAAWNGRGMGLAIALNNLGRTLYPIGRLADAEQALLEARASLPADLGAQHVLRGSIGNNLAEVYARQGRLGDAEALYRQVIALADQAGELSSLDGALVVHNLGECLLDQGRLDEALVEAERAVAILERVAPPGLFATEVARSARGWVLLELGRLDDAERDLRQAHDTLEAQLGAADERTRQAAQRLAELARRRAAP